MRRAGIMVVCLALLGAAAAARPASADGVVAAIDRPEATIQDQLMLTITVEGSRSAQPELPELPDFEVYPRGQSTQMSFVNGRVTSSVSYSFLLVPKREGSFTIGPATVELDGRVYATEPISVRILGATERPQETQDLFISTKVSTTRPYVGQEVIYIWRFYRRVRIGDARLEPQEFDGFLVEDLGELREYQATVNGVQYLVSEIRKALFPQEEGAAVIPSSRLTCEVLVRNRRGRPSMLDDFFGTASTETKVLRSREIDLDVQPLPPPPADFSGLIGTFDLAAKISKAEIKVGESATLQLTISGSGNVQMISEPRLPALPAFKIYDDQPKGSIERSGARLSGSRTYTKALVPLEAGELLVPPLSLSFFDPDAGVYRTARTAAIPLQVAAAAGTEELRLTESMAPTTGKVAVRILADDLLPIYTGLDAVSPAPPAGLPRGWWLLPSLLLPPAVFVGAWQAQRRRERFARDLGLQRRHRALRRARRELRSVTGRTGDSREAARAASRCLRQYIGDKLGIEGSALTASEVDDRLRRRGVSEQVVTRTHGLLERLEAAQFGAAEVPVGDLVTEIRDLIRRLERQIR